MISFMTACFHISTFLSHVANLEQKSADLYAFYAAVFEDNARAAAVFREMKREEIAHKNQALFRKRIVDKNPHDYPEINIDISPLTDLINDIETHISEGVFSVDDAVDFAVRLERSAVEVHYRTLPEKECPKLAELTAFLKNGDEAHIKKLLDLKNDLST